MSTEIATRDTAPALPEPHGSGANMIREAAAVMVDAHSLAKAVCNTQMVPKHFQGKPDECAAAMLYGASLGFDPMQSVKSIYVVHGQAALYARAMDALVKGAGHQTWTDSTSDESVTVSGQRKGSNHVETSTWDIKRADRAGYTNNAKYKSDPQAMLYAKALSEVCRKIAPDVLSGVYSVEELRMERVESEVVGRRPNGGLAAALSEDDQPADEESPYLNPQSKLGRAMFATFNEAGITKNPDRLGYVSTVIGREITTSKEMTDDDARAVIAKLREVIDGETVDGEIVGDTTAEPAAEPDPTLDENFGKDGAQ